jgi:hypothetical protein
LDKLKEFGCWCSNFGAKLWSPKSLKRKSELQTKKKARNKHERKHEEKKKHEKRNKGQCKKQIIKGDKNKVKKIELESLPPSSLVLACLLHP